MVMDTFSILNRSAQPESESEPRAEVPPSAMPSLVQEQYILYIQQFLSCV
jgi:hypothetical protein